MKSLEFYGRIEGGRLILNNRKMFSEAIKDIENVDVEIVIKKKNRRSTQQNRYYWGVVVWSIRQRLTELGHRYSAEDVHAYLKDRFNGENISNEDGELVACIGKSTVNMNKSEFGDYVERIAQWASESLSIYIPPPNAPTNELVFTT